MDEHPTPPSRGSYHFSSTKFFWPEGLNVLLFLRDALGSEGTASWPCAERNDAARGLRHAASTDTSSMDRRWEAAVARLAESARRFSPRPSRRFMPVKPEVTERNGDMTPAAVRELGKLFILEDADLDLGWLGPITKRAAYDWWVPRQGAEFQRHREGKSDTVISDGMDSIPDNEPLGISVEIAYLSCDEMRVERATNSLLLASASYAANPRRLVEDIRAAFQGPQ